MRKLFFILVSVFGISACAKYSSSEKSPVEITLSAEIENESVRTKVPFELTKPTGENPVTAAIWASTTSGSYQGTQADPPGPDESFIDYHNSTCFTGDSRQLLDHQLFYPSNGDKVYFVGLCPRSEGGWQAGQATPGGPYNVAHHVFDGKTDVMFASEISNSISSSAPTVLTFRHVLTWIKFNVVADSDEAIKTWGNVRKITVASNNEINVNITDKTCSFTKSGTDELSAYCIDKKGNNTDDEFENQNIALTTTAQPVAYSLCAAVVASPADPDFEYSITVDTEYRPNTKVNINLKDVNGNNYSGNTEGKSFIVTLNFKLGENIVTTAQVSEWTNAGFGVISIGEKESDDE